MQVEKGMIVYYLLSKSAKVMYMTINAKLSTPQLQLREVSTQQSVPIYHGLSIGADAACQLRLSSIWADQYARIIENHQTGFYELVAQTQQTQIRDKDGAIKTSFRLMDGVTFAIGNLVLACEANNAIKIIHVDVVEVEAEEVEITPKPESNLHRQAAQEWSWDVPSTKEQSSTNDHIKKTFREKSPQSGQEYRRPTQKQWLLALVPIAVIAIFTQNFLQTCIAGGCLLITVWLPLSYYFIVMFVIIAISIAAISVAESAFFIPQADIYNTLKLYYIYTLVAIPAGVIGLCLLFRRRRFPIWEVFVPGLGVDRLLCAIESPRWHIVFYCIPVVGQIFGFHAIARFIAKAEGIRITASAVRLLIFQGCYILYSGIRATTSKQDMSTEKMASWVKTYPIRGAIQSPACSDESGNIAGLPRRKGVERRKKKRVKSQLGVYALILFAIGITAFFIISTAKNPFTRPPTITDEPSGKTTPAPMVSTIEVTFRHSKRTSMGQPVFKNSGTIPLVNLSVNISRNSRSTGPQMVIPKLEPGEERILPREEGWVLEPGEMVIITMENGDSHRFSFK